MTKNNRLRFAEIILLVMIWTVMLASPVLFRKDDELGWENYWGPLQTILPLFILFLLNRFILVPQLLFRKKSLQYFILTGLLIAIMTLGVFLFSSNFDEPGMKGEPVEQFHQPPPHLGLGPGEHPPQASDPKRGGPVPPFANFLIFSILMIGFDTGLKTSFKLVEAEQIKDKLEKDNVESQLAFLRNQVSPHFFMNTLNNIHSLIDFDTNEAKESIIRLSKLMRHLLYDSENEKIPIQKEMEFISNYVDLMKLRYSDKVKIDLLVPKHLPDKSIPPLLYTSFLENAFKHGVSYQQASFIDISFLYADNMLTFEIANSNIPPEKPEESYGIGIENSRKRLDLLYGDTYKLEIRDTRDEYHVYLSIPV